MDGSTVRKLFACCCVLFALARGTAFAQAGPEAKDPIEVRLVSAALKGNRLGDPVEQRLLVFLPPSYEKGSRRYPVIYFLPSYGEGPEEVNLIVGPYRRLLQAGRAKELIIVSVNGKNAFSGSFYVNSPVTGNWEDFAAREAVDYVDAHFRTLAVPVSRGLAGFSMGGFGALSIGLRHPDRFSAVSALCPGLFAPGGLARAMRDWTRMPPVNDGYGAAFAPNANKTRPFWDIPKFDGSAADAAVIAKWENGFGNPEAKIREYLARKTPLRALHLGYGRSDMFGWITDGTRHFSELLKKNGIAHDLVALDSGHDITALYAMEHLFPFYFKHLAY